MNIDWNSLQFIASILIAAGLVLYWAISFRRARRDEAREPQRIFAAVLPSLKDARTLAGDATGTYKLEGTHRGRPFQFKVIVDNMTARKLPCLWLMVTRPEPQPVPQVIDLMMRPRGHTAFSNFDLLQHRLPPPPGFPIHVAARSDEAASVIAWGPIVKLAPLFTNETAKELLVSPKGLRLVVLLAEANRARYGVFRQADFGKPVVSADLAHELLSALIELEDDLKLENSEETVHGSA